jgi:hypothetical protein
MKEYNINHIFSTEKIKNHFYAEDEFVKYFIHWTTDILENDGAEFGLDFDIPLYHLYYSTIDLVGFAPHLGKFIPKILILKYVENEPDYEEDEDDFHVLDFLEENMEEKLVAVPHFKEFAINNPLIIDDVFIGGHMMFKVSFEIFCDPQKKGYHSLALRRKWDGLP